MTPDTSLLLKDMQQFVDIPPEEFVEFTKLFAHKHIRKNELFYSQGTIPRYSPFVIRGCMRQYHTDETGEEKTVRFIEEGAWAGQIGSMRNKVPTNLNLQAIEDTEVLAITIENADHGLIKFPWYQKYFVTKYPLDHGRLLDEAARIKTQPPEASYRWMFKEHPSLLRRVPQHYIASYLNIRPETLSRIRNKIAREIS